MAVQVVWWVVSLWLKNQQYQHNSALCRWNLQTVFVVAVVQTEVVFGLKLCCCCCIDHARSSNQSITFIIIPTGAVFVLFCCCFLPATADSHGQHYLMNKDQWTNKESNQGFFLLVWANNRNVFSHLSELMWNPQVSRTEHWYTLDGHRCLLHPGAQTHKPCFYFKTYLWKLHNN